MRRPPHSADAEASILGAILLRDDALDEVELEPEDFYDPKHRMVFEAMRDVRAKEGRVDDPVLVGDELERRGKLGAVGGLAFLSELVAAVPTADNISHYVEIVRDKALAREIILATSEIAAKGFGDYGTAEEYLGEAHAFLARLEARRPSLARMMGDLLIEAGKRALKRADQRASGEALTDRVPTGLRDVDAIMGGGVPVGKLTILAGRPGHGKSSLARTFVLGAAQLGYPGHVFSLEDNHAVYGERMLSDLAGVALTRIDTGELEQAHGLRISDAVSRGASLPILVDDEPGLSSAQVMARVRRERRRLQTRLVVVDYVQLCEEPGTKTELERVGAALRGLVKLARREQVALVALSQLTRDNVREGRRPRASDLRGTGQLEQDARVILFIHRPTDKNGRPRDGAPAEFILEKRSQGEAGLVEELDWDAATATYRTRFGGRS